jgi:sorbitol/mannitol transport system substrate-binding protein
VAISQAGRGRRSAPLICTAGIVAVVAAGCAGAGGGGGSGGNSSGGGGGKSVNVLMVNNPQMLALQKLTADNFTKQTGITVNYTVLPENDVRDKISQEFSSQAGQ